MQEVAEVSLEKLPELQDLHTPALSPDWGMSPAREFQKLLQSLAPPKNVAKARMIQFG